jgi:aryl-alcohol dehydrogenase-like predicted oxidoreductase
MQRADFLTLGKETSQIGFGCGRIFGHSSVASSTKLLEAALDLGIRYFDVAPSYGMGTAEDVLGAVVGADPAVTVATKIGVPRPMYSARANLVRRVAKSAVSRTPAFKGVARSVYARSQPSGAERPRYDFSEGAVRASLEESLGRLRRDAFDVFLAHEPHPADLDGPLRETFDALVREELVSAYGVGVGAQGDRWSQFGSIWQSRWPGTAIHGYQGDVHYTFHGLVRFTHNGANEAVERPSARVRAAVELAPRSILLVSASTPRRLRELLQEL